MDGYKHYIRVENGIVIDGYADWQTDKRTAGEIQLTGEFGRHFQMNLYTDRMQFKYKIVNGQMVERTQAELGLEWAARPTPPPADNDRIKAVEDMLLEIMLGG